MWGTDGGGHLHSKNHPVLPSSMRLRMHENCLPVNILYSRCGAPASWAAQHTTVCLKLLHGSPHMSDRPSLETFHNSVNLCLSKHHMPPNILCKADYFWSIKFLKKRQNLNFKGFNFEKCRILVDFKLTEIGVEIHVINWEGTEMLPKN